MEAASGSPTHQILRGAAFDVKTLYPGRAFRFLVVRVHRLLRGLRLGGDRNAAPHRTQTRRPGASRSLGVGEAAIASSS